MICFSPDLDDYSRIKLINYIRQNVYYIRVLFSGSLQYLLPQNPSPSSLMSISTPYPWEQDTYLTPVLKDDPLLQVDFYGETLPSDVIITPCTEENGRVPECDYQRALTRAVMDLEKMR